MSTKQDQAIEEVRAKQRNTLWPETIGNRRSVDAFLWKGSPDAPLVQRIAAWVFGGFFILGSIAWLDAAFKRHSILVGVLSIAWFLVGGKVFLNGFRKRKVEKLSDHGID
ncbi:MAG: hypothetical protein ABR987_08710 [Terracidiphilus sp.]|jgi:hypothetical protein